MLIALLLVTACDLRAAYVLGISDPDYIRVASTGGISKDSAWVLIEKEAGNAFSDEHSRIGATVYYASPLGIGDGVLFSYFQSSGQIWLVGVYEHARGNPNQILKYDYAGIIPGIQTLANFLDPVFVENYVRKETGKEASLMQLVLCNSEGSGIDCLDVVAGPFWRIFTEDGLEYYFYYTGGWVLLNAQECRQKNFGVEIHE